MDTIAWDSSLRFSAKAFIQMMIRITPILFANGLPAAERIKRLESCFNNAGLDAWERRVEKGEMIYLASVFGGTSID